MNFKFTLLSFQSLAFALVVIAIGLCFSRSTVAQDGRLSELKKLIAQLDSKDADERVAAAEKIGKLGPQAIAAAPELLDRLEDKGITSLGDRVAPAFSRALAKLGPETVGPLVKQLETKSLLRFAGVCEALHFLGEDAEPAVEVILPLLPTAPQERLWGLIYVLEGIGEPAAPAVARLNEVLTEGDLQLKIVTCRALAAIGPASKPATENLLKEVADGAGSVKGHAALALANIGAQDEIDVPSKLAEQLDQPFYPVREKLFEALGRFGSDAKQVAPKLDAYFEDKRFNAKVDLALAYYRITGETEKPLALLSEVASDFQNELEAIVAMGKMGEAAAPVTELLVSKLDSEDPDIVYEACFALAAIGDNSEAILSRIKELAKSDDEFVAEGARKSLAILKTKN